MAACSPHERTMPRRRPGQVRTDIYHRLRTTTTAHGPNSSPISNLPGLSPHGRTVLAFLERTRLWPGATEQALGLWAEFIRSPHHRIYDYAYDGTGCGVWECCPPMTQ